MIWQLIDLDTIDDKASLKIPNITLFDNDSYIKSDFHKHNLKYKSVNSKWGCDFCLRIFDSNVDSFGCRECDFILCYKCLFNKEESPNNKITIKYKVNPNDSKISLFGGYFVKNNKNVCKIIYNNEEMELQEYLSIDNSIKNKKELENQLKDISHIIRMDYMFFLYIVYIIE